MQTKHNGEQQTRYINLGLFWVCFFAYSVYSFGSGDFAWFCRIFPHCTSALVSVANEFERCGLDRNEFRLLILARYWIYSRRRRRLRCLPLAARPKSRLWRHRAWAAASAGIIVVNIFLIFVLLAARFLCCFRLRFALGYLFPSLLCVII